MWVVGILALHGEFRVLLFTWRSTQKLKSKIFYRTTVDIKN